MPLKFEEPEKEEKKVSASPKPSKKAPSAPKGKVANPKTGGRALHRRVHTKYISRCAKSWASG